MRPPLTEEFLTAARAAVASADGAGVRVAVIDSGIDASHPALSRLRLADDVAVESDGVRLVPRDGAGEDLYGHGTAVAGILARLAPAAEVGSFRVLDAGLAGRAEAVREGVRLAIERGYGILNCSFGSRGDARSVMQYKEWIDEAYLAGVHVVAACNNFDFSVREWPGHFPSVIAVNMARAGGLSLYRARGTLVEFAAAGERVEVAWRGGGRKLVTGSSYAAAHVSALLARLLSVFPRLTPVEAKAVLHRLAEPISPAVAGRNTARAGG